MSRRRAVALGALVALVASLALALGLVLRGGRARPTPYVFRLPEGCLAPPVPPDDPMTVEKVELGRVLFYDERLSGNGTMSCGSCHVQRLGFADGRARPVGSTGEVVRRNAMGLTDVGFVARLTWAHPSLDRLEQQMLLPMFGDAPVELGLRDAAELEARLARDPELVERFRAAFPDADEPVSLHHVTQAIASFERTLVSCDAPYDRYVRGDTAALDASASRGLELFFSERLECFHCHGGPHFADSTGHPGQREGARAFHNTGLYDVDGRGAYPAADRGLVEHTGREDDRGRFRAPSLRNVAVTGPYMHDGSIATLAEVLDHYAAGGRAPRGAEGTETPRSAFLTGFVLTDGEARDLIAFLEALTDRRFLTNPAFADPEPARRRP